MMGLSTCGFNDILFLGLVRESGAICKCYDEQIGDFLVSDQLRKVCVLSSVIMILILNFI